MKAELVSKLNTETVQAEDFGIEPVKANELTSGLAVAKAEKELLIQEFEQVSALEITKENIPKFKELRNRISKNRTQGTNKWHKANKEFFLIGGRFIDAIKNKENQINEAMEAKLLEGENYFDNLEKERLAKLQAERAEILSQYIDNADEVDLSIMEEDYWNYYLKTKKDAQLARIEAERIEEQEYQAKLKAEKEANDKIIAENKKLKEEAIEAERLAKIEKDKRLALEQEEAQKRQEEADKQTAIYEAELKKEREMLAKAQKEQKEKDDKAKAELKAILDNQARIETERKAEADKLQAEVKRLNDIKELEKQQELSKGDSAKVDDLIADFTLLKTKYKFDSKPNIKMYLSVSTLIDRVIDFINKTK